MHTTDRPTQSTKIQESQIYDDGQCGQVTRNHAFEAPLVMSTLRPSDTRNPYTKDSYYEHPALEKEASLASFPVWWPPTLRWDMNMTHIFVEAISYAYMGLSVQCVMGRSIPLCASLISQLVAYIRGCVCAHATMKPREPSHYHAHTYSAFSKILPRTQQSIQHANYMRVCCYTLPCARVQCIYQAITTGTMDHSTC